jgi:hypothetical protein
MNRLEKACLTGLVSLPLGVGTIAFGFLNTPVSISCNSLSDNTAISTRLHCAQQRAQRQTPESLAAAIELLNNVAIDDPYYDQSQRLIERWSLELINQAESEFQAGNLDQAIAMVRVLPQNAKVKAWKSIWEKGESLRRTAQAQVEKREWQQAFQTARQLRQLENEYWANQQYDLLSQQIQRDRELHDVTVKDPVDSPKKSPKETDLNLPEAPKIARSNRPVLTPKEDAPIVRRSGKATTQPPASPIEPEVPKVQPAPQVEIEPEPPLETLDPIEPVQPAIPVREVSTGRT